MLCIFSDIEHLEYVTKENPEDLFPESDEKRIQLFKKILVGFSGAVIVWNLIMMGWTMFYLSKEADPAKRTEYMLDIFFNITDIAAFSFCIVGIVRRNIRFLAFPITYTYWSFLFKLFRAFIYIVFNRNPFASVFGALNLVFCVLFIVFYVLLLKVYKNMEVSTEFVQWVDDYAKEHGKKVIVMDA
jgi:hypothetical protein